ncbi:MAG: hypothetical protein WBL55_15760, partial [Xanthobacteraceae bacterium]
MSDMHREQQSSATAAFGKIRVFSNSPPLRPFDQSLLGREIACNSHTARRTSPIAFPQNGNEHRKDRASRRRRCDPR